MVQQVITLCDVCYDENTQTAASQHRVAIDGADFTIELCEHHHDELVAPLARLVADLGVSMTKAKPPRAPRAPRAPGAAPKPTGNRPMAEPCLICGHRVNTSTALTIHYQHIHKVDGFTGAYGLTCPLCTDTRKSASALSVHVKREHPEVGGGGIPEAFRYANAMGDPHDVVAKQLARLGVAAMPPAVSAA